ncbi:MAG: outer membrane beta-barrel protein [Bacteroidota bacterium]|jgi:hypothetical protein
MKFYLLITIISLSLFSQAQSRIKMSAGFSIAPMICGSFTGSNASAIAPGFNNKTYAQVADSFGRDETYRISYGFHAWFNYMLGSKWSIQTGLGYTDVGFQRIQDNPKFKDKIHPGIGRGLIEDLTDNTKSIAYDYRYQYLQIPVMFNYFVHKTSDYKWLFHATAGVGLNLLLSHKITANLKNFYIDNNQTFDIDSTGYEGSAFTLNTIVGFKAEYRYEKKISLFIQPLLGIYPISVSQTEMTVRPYFFGIYLGASYALNDK